MVSTLAAIIIILIILAILVFIGWLSFSFQIAMGQTIGPPVSPSTALPTGTPPASVGTPPTPQPTPPAIVAPTAVPTATPTAANPNFQYLPQKAYVQSFAPEQGVPSSTALQAAPVVVPVQGQTATGSAPQAPFDIMAILATVGAAGAYLKGHLANNKANKVEGIAKETMAGTLLTKEQLTELARITYQMNQEKANQITDAPSIKLENLQKDKDEFAEKATKT